MTNTRSDLITTCTGRGGNAACKKAAREGRQIHIIPLWSSDDVSNRLVMPTYHYATREEAIAAVQLARDTAPVVTCDADLYDFRARGIAHKLPVGWTDPTRR